VGILHRKADVDCGAASGIGLLHDYRSRFFPAFSRHAQPTLSSRSVVQKLQTRETMDAVAFICVSISFLSVATSEQGS
jgi:hypothetical protein